MTPRAAHRKAVEVVSSESAEAKRPRAFGWRPFEVLQADDLLLVRGQLRDCLADLPNVVDGLRRFWA